MRPSLLTYFALISLLAVTFSCSTPKVILDRADNSSSGSFDKKTLKATVFYKENEITGRVLIKKSEEDTYRIAFYNEMGMTYLEGVLDGKKLDVQNIIPALDHKLFIRKFKKSIISCI